MCYTDIIKKGFRMGAFLHGGEGMGSFKEKMALGDQMEMTGEYAAFVEKFKSKKTTDDCYTPDNVYAAVHDWAVKEYGLEGARIIRPFYPGGDYTKEDYSGNCAVIDNPPFSIFAEICRWYNQRGIRFFLFGPAKTIFSGSGLDGINYVICGLSIMYDNGASVDTSFATNMGQYKIMVAPDLYEAIKAADDENRKEVTGTQERRFSAAASFCQRKQQRRKQQRRKRQQRKRQQRKQGQKHGSYRRGRRK